MMKRDLVIILIIAHKSELSEFEEISLAQCYRILNNHPIKLVCPKGLDVSCYRKINNNIEIDFINPKWQANYRAFNRLKIDPFLYQRYSNYEFILFYELDAFVFRDDLNYWCSQNYDYIGAPWFNDFNPVTGHYSSIDVGNGGFSLRKVNSALKALYSFSLITNPKFIWDNWQDRGRPLRGLVSLIKNCTIFNNSFYLFNDFRGNEDIFWGKFINKNFSWFIVSPVDKARQFSFEVNPRFLFLQNENCLPFGCHAWWKYDLNFWLPHIQKFGYLNNF